MVRTLVQGQAHSSRRARRTRQAWAGARDRRQRRTEVNRSGGSLTGERFAWAGVRRAAGLGRPAWTARRALPRRRIGGRRGTFQRRLNTRIGGGRETLQQRPKKRRKIPAAPTT